MSFYVNGKYAVRITDYVSGESEKKRTPFFRIFFEVLRRVRSDGSTEPVGQQYERNATLYVIASCDWTVKRTFEALDSPVSLEPEWLKGTEREAYCISERGDDGKMYERWSFYQPGTGKRQDIKELSDRQRRTEEEKLKRRLGVHGKVPTTADVEQEAATDGDDIPF